MGTMGAIWNKHTMDSKCVMGTMGAKGVMGTMDAIRTKNAIGPLVFMCTKDVMRSVGIM